MLFLHIETTLEGRELEVQKIQNNDHPNADIRLCTLLYAEATLFCGHVQAFYGMPTYIIYISHSLTIRNTYAEYARHTLHARYIPTLAQPVLSLAEHISSETVVDREKVEAVLLQRL